MGVHPPYGVGRSSSVPLPRANRTARSVLRRIVEAHRSGAPLVFAETLAFDETFVRRLFDNDLIETRTDRHGRSVVVPSNLKALAAYDARFGISPDDEPAGAGTSIAPSPEAVRPGRVCARTRCVRETISAAERRLLREALAAGQDLADIAIRTNKPLAKVRALVDVVMREMRENGDDFALHVPAWRVRDLRNRLLEAELMGRRDGGEAKAHAGGREEPRSKQAWPHRSLQRRYDRGYALAKMQAVVRRRDTVTRQKKAAGRREARFRVLTSDARSLLAAFIDRDRIGLRSGPDTVARIVQDGLTDALLDLFDAGCIDVESGAKPAVVVSRIGYARHSRKISGGGDA